MRPSEPRRGGAPPLDVPLTVVQRGLVLPAVRHWATAELPPLAPGLQIPAPPPPGFFSCPHRPKGLPPVKQSQVVSLPVVFPREDEALPDSSSVDSGPMGPGVLLRAKDHLTQRVVDLFEFFQSLFFLHLEHLLFLCGNPIKGLFLLLSASLLSAFGS